MNAVPNVTAPLLGGAVRVAVGVLWVLEGVEKYRAGFGAADILLVADGTASNPRTPWWFTPVRATMQTLPDAFGLAIPALEVLLGLALIAGVLTGWLPSAPSPRWRSTGGRTSSSRSIR